MVECNSSQEFGRKWRGGGSLGFQNHNIIEMRSEPISGSMPTDYRLFKLTPFACNCAPSRVGVSYAA